MGITNVLYNRSEFLEKAQEFLDACESSGWCIISIDIERFKLFNNWYGQEAGDILLQNISQYLLRVQQMKGYLAGYFGGDHFFMCIPDDEQLINLIYKTIRSYIGIHSQNEGFFQSSVSTPLQRSIRIQRPCVTMHSSLLPRSREILINGSVISQMRSLISWKKNNRCSTT
ncbi:MAG: diguanylate cyclase domain-containing protein [Blautia obeum]